MAIEPAEAPLFVDGDYEAPPGTRLDRGVLATGHLVLGRGCVCHGDLFGADGIELGADVEVDGNLFSHGPIRWGNGLQLNGTIYSQAPRPMEAALARAGLAQRPPASLPLMQRTLSRTLQLLLELAWDGHLEGEVGYPTSWWGLAWDEAAEISERALAMADGIYRQGTSPSDWDRKAIVEVLIPLALGTTVPVAVHRVSEREARLKVGRPDRVFDPAGSTRGWAWPTLSLLNLVGFTANPAFRLVLNGEEGLLEPDAEAEVLDLTVEFLEDPAASAPRHR